MSSINVNTIKSRLGGPPTLPSGVVVSAAATFNNDVSIGGTLTYEDVTSVDVVGLITARSGIKFGVAGVGGTIDGVGNAIISGITTVGTALSLADNVRAKFGNDGDLAIYHDGTTNIIDSASANLEIRHGAEKLAAFAQDGQAELWFDSSKKFETTNTGAIITGICTATSFSGDGSSLTGIAATSNINTNNIQVSGITTFQSLQEPFDFWLFAG